MSIPTPSPTSFEAAYYGILALSILGAVVIVLLCCGCVARAQNNHKAWMSQKSLLVARLKELRADDNASAQDIADFLAKVEKSNQGGLLEDFADSLVVPLTDNDVSSHVSSFFYHSTLGRLLLVANQGVLNLCCLVLSLIFSGLAVTYINSHVITQMDNQASASLSILMGSAVLLLVMSICRDQFGIFLQPRLGGTGVIEREAYPLMAI